MREKCHPWHKHSLYSSVKQRAQQSISDLSVLEEYLLTKYAP